MRRTDGEPEQEEIEMLVTDEERLALNDLDVPEDVKNEIRERLDRFRDADLEEMRAEDARNEP